MHPAIELLLARMESNPEEFVNTINGRWGKILTKVSEAAPEQDWELIKAKLKTVRLDVLHKQIMQELCAPDSPEQLEFDFGRAS